MAKDDSPKLDANLSNLDLGAEAREYYFAYKGERFTTIDIADLDPDALMDALKRLNEGDLWALSRLFLERDTFKKFKSLKPSVWVLKGFNDMIEPALKELMGDPEGFTG